MAKTQTTFEKKFKVKRNDTVLVMTGKYKGMTGKVKDIDRDAERVFVSGVNLISPRSKKNKQTGNSTKTEASIHISNVSHFVEIDGKNVPSKVRIEVEGNKKSRVLAKTGKAVVEHNYSKSESNIEIPSKEEIKRASKAAVKAATETVDSVVETVESEVPAKAEKEKKVAKVASEKKPASKAGKKTDKGEK